jgi:hypothetical protein
MGGTSKSVLLRAVILGGSHVFGLPQSHTQSRMERSDTGYLEGVEKEALDMNER